MSISPDFTPSSKSVSCKGSIRAEGVPEGVHRVDHPFPRSLVTWSPPTMLVLAAPLFGLSLGVAFAWAGAEELARIGGSTTSRTLVVATLFGVLVYAPACGYFQAFFPDWSYGYFLDGERRPVALDLALVLVDGFSAPIGLTLLSRAAAARRTSTLLRAAAIPSTIALLSLVAALPRLRVFATYAEFHGDFGTQPLTGSPVGYALIWMTAVVACAAAWTIRVLRGLSVAARAN
jgi:hypothetical protein